MANVNANVNVIVNTKQAQSQIASFQSTINAFNKSVVTSSSAAVAQQAALNKALMDGAIASRMFTAKMVPVTSSVDAFSRSLEKGKFTLGQYTRFAGSQLPGMSRVFKKEFDTIQRVAESNVRRLQTQFTNAGVAANGMNRAIALTPTSLNNMAAAQSIANQKAMIFNKLMKDGSTSLLNWGKNTQWAGRQLMVGFTIPLTIFAGVAAKTFKDLEAQAINFKKVYGDIFTTDIEVERNLAAVKELSLELTKYGIAVKDTMELAGIAAQSGLRGADLMEATTQATRLAVLGQMEQAEAMKTVISLQTAFQQSNEELGESVDFLNIIENQTVLSLEDVAGAIPRVAPVIKGLGGDVKDLAVLLVAMKEGGVSAAEGANALKNSLGRLINPTSQAQAMAAKFGINLMKIVKDNKGEVMPMLLELSSAMKGLGGLQQQQLLSTVFGKFQYARIGALFKNLQDDTSQARRAMDLTAMSAEDLAKTAEQELSVVENAVSTKFTAAMERAKVAIAPIGELFLKAVTPLLNGISKLFEKFESLPDNVKNIIGIVIGVIGGVVPVGLMVIGLLGNLVANGLKFLNTLRKLFAQLTGMGSKFSEMAIGEQEAALAANSLEGNVDALTRTMLLQQEAVQTLITLYGNLAGAASGAAAAMPTGFPMAGAASAASASPFSILSRPAPDFRGFNEGIVRLPGTGKEDTIPAMLAPGESVITAAATEKFAPLLEAMNSGKLVLPGYVDGVVSVGRSGEPSRSVAVGQISSRSLAPLEALANKAVDILVGSGVELEQAIGSVADRITQIVSSIEAEGGRVSKKAVETALKESGSLAYTGEQITFPGSYEMAHFSGSGMKSREEIENWLATQEVDVQNRVRAIIDKAENAQQEYFKILDNRVVAMSTELNQALGETGSGKTAPIETVVRDLIDRSEFAHAELKRQLLEAGMPIEEVQSAIGRITDEISSGITNLGDIAEVTAEQVDSLIDTAYQNVSQANQDVTNAYQRMSDPSVIVDPTGRVRDGKATSSRTDLSPESYRASAQKTAYREQMSMGVQGEVPYGAHSKQISNEMAGMLRVSREQLVAAYNSLEKEAKERLSALANDNNAFLEQLAVEIRDAGIDLGNLSIEGIAEGSQSASASRRARQEGDNVGEGLEQGLRESKPEVRKAAEELRSEVDLGLSGSAQTQSERIKSLIRGDGGGSGVPPRPTGAAGAGEPERRPSPQENAEAIKSQILEKQSLALQQEALSFKGSMKKVFAETTNAIKVFPKLGKDLANNLRAPIKGLKNELDGIRNVFRMGGPQIRAAMTEASQANRISIKQAGAELGNSIRQAGLAVRQAGKTIGPALGNMIGSGAQRAAMGLSGVAMAASMLPGPLGEMAQKIMPVSMGLMAVSTMLPLFKSKLGLAMVAVGAVAALYVKTRKDLDGLANSAMEAGSNLGGFANRMSEITAATGYKFAGERMQDRMLRLSNEDREAMSEFADYFEGERGQKFLGDLKKLSKPERYKEVAKMISLAIADGMDEKTAKAYGFSIAKYLGDAVMGQRLKSAFASGEFKSGAAGMRSAIDIIGQRQTALDATGGYRPQEVGQSSASRFLAEKTGFGQFDTQKSMFAEGVAKTGATALAGAATGALAGSVVPIVGTAVGAVAGALVGTVAGGIMAFRDYQKQIEILNSNIGQAAMVIGSATQTLGELRSAEQSLILLRQEGKISAEEYASELQRLKDIEAQAVASLGSVIDSMMMGGQVDQEALQGAMKNQLVVAGFEGDLAEAVVGIVNAKDVAKSLFPEEDFEAVMADERKREVVKMVMTETLAGITPENAAEKLANVKEVWAALSEDLLLAVDEGLTLDEMRAIVMGENAGRAILEGLLSGAERGLEPPSAAGTNEQKAAAGQAKTILETTGAGSTEVQVGSQKFKAERLTVDPLEAGIEQMESGWKNAAAETSDAHATRLAEMFEDLTFTESDISNMKGYRDRMGLSTEQFLTQAASAVEGPGATFRENIQAALEDPENFDWMQFEGMGLGTTPEQIQASLQGIIDQALFNLEEGIILTPLGDSFQIVADKFGAWIESQGPEMLAEKNISQEQLDAGLVEAGRALPAGQLETWMDNPEQYANELNTVLDTIALLQTEAMQGISVEFAIATVFDGSQDPQTALANLQRDFAGLGETFGTQTQTIIDQLLSKQDALAELGKMGSFEDAFDEENRTQEQIAKTEDALDSLAAKYNVSKDTIKSWWKDSESTAKKSVSTQAGELKKFGNSIKDLANITSEGDGADPLTRLGIDVENIDIETLEKFGPAAETVGEFWPILENLNPEIDMSAYVNFLTLGNDDEPLDPAEAAANVNKLNKLWSQIENAEDITAKKTALFELFAEKDGEPVSQKELTGAWDSLIDEFDEATIMNLPADVLEKALQFKIDAQGFEDAALAQEEFAKLIEDDDPKEAARYRAKAASLRAAAAAANRSASIAVAAASTKGGASKKPSGGGSKGGGGEKSIIEQLKENVKNLKQMSKLVTNAIAGNKPAFKNFIAGPFAMEFIEYLKGQGEKAVKELGNNAKKFKQAYRLFIKERALELKMGLALERQAYKDELKAAERRSLFMSGFGGSMAQRESVTSRFGEENMALFLQLDGMTKAQRQAEGLQKTYLELKKNRDLLMQQAPKMAAIDQLNSFRDSVKSANEGFQLFNALVARGFSPTFAQKLIELGVGMELLTSSTAEARKEFSRLVAEARKLEGQESEQNVLTNIAAGREDLLATYRIMVMFPGITQESIDAMKALGVTAGSSAETMQTAFNGVRSAAAIAKMAMDAFARSSMLIDASMAGIQRQIERINRIEIRPLEQQIKTIENGIKAIDKVIKGIQKTIKPIEKEIKDFEKTVKSLEKEIKVYDKQIKDIQKTLKPLEKENEALREVEKEINDEFEKREKALDQIEKINARISAQQRSQLSMAKAIAEGDIYAVAAAMQQYRAEQAQMNAEQTRESLREGNERRREEITKKIEENEKQIKLTNEQIESIQERIEGIQERIEKIQEDIESRTERIADLNEQIADEQEKIADEQEKIAGLQERIEASKEKQLALEEKIYKLQLLRSMLDTSKAIREAVAEGDVELVKLLQAEQQMNLDVAKGEDFSGLGINAAPILGMAGQSIDPARVTEAVTNGIEAAFLMALADMDKWTDNWIAMGTEGATLFKDKFMNLLNLSDEEFKKLPAGIQGFLTAIKNGELAFPETAEGLSKALTAYGVKGSDLMQLLLGKEGAQVSTRVGAKGQEETDKIEDAGKKGKKTIDAEADAIGKSAANLGKKVAAAEKEFEKGNITFRQAALRILGAMAEAIGSAAIAKVDTGGFNNALKEISGALKTTITEFSNTLSGTLDTILTIGNKFKDNIEVIEGVADDFGGIMVTVSEKFEGILQGVSDKFGDIGTDFNTKFQGLMKTLVDNFGESIKAEFGRIVTALQTFTNNNDGLPSVLGRLLDALSGFVDSVNNAVGVLNSFLGTAIARIQQEQTAAVNAIIGERNAAVGAIAAEKSRPLPGSYAGGMIKGYAMGGKIKGYPMGGKIPYAMGGVAGDGARDSVPAILTPGEFVVRKSMVKKYGQPLFESINQGSFAMPRYNMPNPSPTNIQAVTTTANINAPVYNTYDMDFAIHGANASADEIANKVMFKIKQVQNQGIRGNRGY